VVVGGDDTAHCPVRWMPLIVTTVGAPLPRASCRWFAFAERPMTIRGDRSDDLPATGRRTSGRGGGSRNVLAGVEGAMAGGGSARARSFGGKGTGGRAGRSAATDRGPAAHRSRALIVKLACTRVIVRRCSRRHINIILSASNRLYNNNNNNNDDDDDKQERRTRCAIIINVIVALLCYKLILYYTVGRSRVNWPGHADIRVTHTC